MSFKSSKKRVAQADRDPNLFYYDTRHSDRSNISISTVERDPVSINRFNTVITEHPINFDGEDYITYCDFKKQFNGK